ncbi:hypothetical protein RHMOL_Rhmol11G0224500 [Rhododendron molle]|uniref:Uncharacterized protein n=1 Tax=Rhododendron molle TaxID=49168 RepID=A0ACC0LV90_RHOML|nr:hypothetical protein RHMOL_Rhmol11G0224500 [Rhododendron molle]
MGDCALVHSRGGGKYGENLAIGNGEFTAAAAVGLWAAQKPNYDYNSNLRAAGQVWALHSNGLEEFGSARVC